MCSDGTTPIINILDSMQPVLLKVPPDVSDFDLDVLKSTLV